MPGSKDNQSLKMFHCYLGLVSPTVFAQADMRVVKIRKALTSSRILDSG